MSRAIIGGVVAAVIAVLTAAAYFVTTSRLETQARRDLRQRVAKAQELLIQNASLEGLGLLKRAEAVAREGDYPRALRAESDSQAASIATLAFRRFRSNLSPDDPKPDILALTDAEGRVIALLDVARPLPNQWIDDDEVKYASLGLALESGQATSELVDFDNKGLMKVGVSPVRDGPGSEVLGAVVIAYAVTSEEAERQDELHEANVAYFHGDELHATSFGSDDPDAPERETLARALFDGGLAEQALSKKLADVVEIELGDDVYLATAGRLPRFSSKPLPEDYPGHRAGAMVLKSLSEATSSFGTVKLAILLVGLGSMIVALLAISVTAKSFIGPIDEIELGIGEIINGDIDRTFRPVGSDLDGLANGLNVMLARLLGRPEPGEEEFDEEGNLVQSGGGGPLHVDTGEMTTKDVEAMALAAEPEPDYYKRLFGEYVEARREAGDDVSSISYESFVAKLRLNEANLKKRYESRAVRFKVVTKDGKVILKPVPLV